MTRVSRSLRVTVSRASHYLSVLELFLAREEANDVVHTHVLIESTHFELDSLVVKLHSLIVVVRTTATFTSNSIVCVHAITAHWSTTTSVISSTSSVY